MLVSRARMRVSIPLLTDRTLPSPSTNWQTPECQLPNWELSVSGSVVEAAIGESGPP